MYAIHLLQEGVKQDSGMGMYVWVALIIFFLMVLLGWLVAKNGWLRKEETPVSAGHGHDEHAHDDHGQAAQSTEAHASAGHEPAEPVGAPEGHAAPVVVPAAKSNGPDDLTVLEGVGPKVAKVLAGIGITTFAGLAAADKASLRSALDAAGYKYMEPAGWVDQAALAAKGDLEGLKKLQSELKGGRKVS